MQFIGVFRIAYSKIKFLNKKDAKACRVFAHGVRFLIAKPVWDMKYEVYE